MVKLPVLLSNWIIELVSVTTDRDEDSGKFTEQYPRKAFLDAVGSVDTATTSKVSNHVGCSYGLAYRRLNALAEEGEITRIEVGSSFVWSQ